MSILQCACHNAVMHEFGCTCGCHRVEALEQIDEFLDDPAATGSDRRGRPVRKEQAND